MNLAIKTPSYTFASPEIKATPEYQRALALETALAVDFPQLFGTPRLACIVDESYDQYTPGCACTLCNSAWPADEPEAHGRDCRADRTSRFSALVDAWEACHFYGWADNYRAALVLR